MTFSKPGALGRADSAGRFDDRDDYIDVPQVRLDRNLTIEVWVYRDSNAETAGVFGTLVGSDYTHRLLWSLNNGSVLAQFRGDFFSKRGAPARRWHHIVYTSTGSAERIYIDGQLDACNTRRA